MLAASLTRLRETRKRTGTCHQVRLWDNEGDAQPGTQFQVTPYSITGYLLRLKNRLRQMPKIMHVT